MKSEDTKIIKRQSLLLWVASLTCLILSATISAQTPAMYAHYIDVGQADATLLEFPCGAILIDSGAQDEEHVEVLLSYLDEFFERRQDLRTDSGIGLLESIMVTHNHIDHTRALQEVVQRFVVRRFIDNGQNTGTGTGDPNFVRSEAANLGIQTREITWVEATTGRGGRGLTNGIIDPIDCGQQGDPEIRVLSGRRENLPTGWTQSQFRNKNNHSLTIRIDFGESSLLFTGDLELEGIEELVDHYGTDPGGLLDVDVYQVGHHGSYNATTENLVLAMTPKIAVISMGNWDFGRDSASPFSTFAYGHPRRQTAELLANATSGQRKRPVQVMVAIRPSDFVPITVSKQIYATGWEGTIVIRTSLDGSFEVATAGLPDVQDAGFPPVDTLATRVQAALSKHQLWLESNGEFGEKVSFTGQELKGLSFAHRNLQYVDFSNAKLTNVDLSSADLSNANFSGADLTGANLSEANLDRTNLTSATISFADLAGALYNPSVSPDLDSIASARGLPLLKYRWIQEGIEVVRPGAISQVRSRLRDSGFIKEERMLTYALNRVDTLESPEDYFRYLLFELTCQWGMWPNLALWILLGLILVFSIPYMFVLCFRSQVFGIWAIWSNQRVLKQFGRGEPERIQFPRSAPGYNATRIANWWQVPLWAIYFSVLSACHFGWRDLNVGSWIARIQRREYMLRPTGWVRVVSGVQSLISVYLLAIWALTYFGRPFG